MEQDQEQEQEQEQGAVVTQLAGRRRKEVRRGGKGHCHRHLECLADLGGKEVAVEVDWTAR